MKYKRIRRREQKELDEFYRDLAWNWVPPRKLRKIRKDDGLIDKLFKIREVYIEEGRKRLVARGFTQHAKPGELCGCGSQEKKLSDMGCPTCNANVWYCPTCKTIVSLATTCTHLKEGDKINA